MSEIIDIQSLFTIPQDVFERLGGTQYAEDVTWECVVCGVVPPTAISNGFLRAKCLCERLLAQIERDEQAREQQRTELLEKRRKACDKCYNWLPTENVQDEQEVWDWSNFREIRYPAVYREMRRYTELNYTEWTNYMVVGSVGTGKTRLLVSALNELSKKLVLCRFLTASALFETIGRMISKHEDYSRYLEEMAHCDVLLIDDLDRVYIRPGMTEDGFQVKTLYSIINQRYLRRKPTWITSNQPDIATYIGVAAFDRLQEKGALLMMDGPSFRKNGLKVIK